MRFLKQVLLQAAVGLLSSCLLSSAYAFVCPAIPPVSVDIVAVSEYGDLEKTEYFAERAEQNRLTLADIRKFQANVAAASDRAARGDSDARLCLAQQMKVWAQGGGLLGRDSSTQAMYVRQWALASLSLALFKADPIDAQSSELIAPWLRLVASRVAEYQSNRPPAARNNLFNWAILGIGVSADLTNDAELWNFAMEGLLWATSAEAITTDGTLKAELKRGASSLRYHGFALQPLIVLASYARMKGFELPLPNKKRLTALACLVRHHEKAREALSRQLEVPQKPLNNDPQGYLRIYWASFPELGVRETGRGERNRVIYLGGNLNVLADVLRDSLPRRKPYGQDVCPSSHFLH